VFRYASGRNDSFYSAVKTCLFCGRIGTMLILVWQTYDWAHRDDIEHRKYFRSRRFAESFEVCGRVTPLRKRETRLSAETTSGLH
jgi:hypothetical protein